MSKKGKKNKQNNNLSGKERAVLLAQTFKEQNQKAAVPKEEPEKEEVVLTEAEQGLNISAEIPSDETNNETIDFAGKLEEEQNRLRDLEIKLNKREKEIEDSFNSRTVKFDEEVDKKVKEHIDGLECDLPTAQERYKKIIEDATNKANAIAAEIKEKEDAVNEKAKKIEELSKQISKQQIQLENDKVSYRLEIGNEISEKYKEQIEKIDTFDEEKTKLEKAIKYYKDNYKALETESKDLREQMADYAIIKAELEASTKNSELLEQKYKDIKKELNALKDKERAADIDPLSLQSKYETLEKDYERALDRIKNCPSEIQLSEYRRKENEFDQLEQQNISLNKELISEKQQKTELLIKSSQLDDYVQYVNILIESKRQLQNELDSLREQYNSENNKKFKALAYLDAHVSKDNPESARDTLDIIVKKFLDFAQNDETPLYYEKTTICSFLAWMASTKIIILEGLSGTGKTSLPLEFAKFAGWYSPTIPVQSAWKDRNDLVGFFNDFKKEYKETDFLKSLYEAELNPDKPSLIVLDEMNISRIEYYFADFLSQLEQPVEKRKIDLLPDQTTSEGMPSLFVEGGKLPIKTNVWFIGTANKDDSTFDITDKVYDRSGVIRFAKRGEKKEERMPGQPVFISYTVLAQSFNRARKASNYLKECKSYYEEIKQDLSEYLSACELNIGNRMTDQLDIFVPVYLACMDSYKKETVRQAIDEFFPYKILRKLDNEYGNEFKKHLDELIKAFKDYGNLNKCVAHLENLQKKLD